MRYILITSLLFSCPIAQTCGVTLPSTLATELKGPDKVEFLLSKSSSHPDPHYHVNRIDPISRPITLLQKREASWNEDTFVQPPDVGLLAYPLAIHPAGHIFGSGSSTQNNANIYNQLKDRMVQYGIDDQQSLWVFRKMQLTHSLDTFMPHINPSDIVLPVAQNYVHDFMSNNGVPHYFAYQGFLRGDPQLTGFNRNDPGQANLYHNLIPLTNSQNYWGLRQIPMIHGANTFMPNISPYHWAPQVPQTYTQYFRYTPSGFAYGGLPTGSFSYNTMNDPGQANLYHNLIPLTNSQNYYTSTSTFQHSFYNPYSWGY